MLLRHQNLGFKYSQLMESMWIISSYTANNYRHFTANCGVTFLTVIWQYLELLMAVQHTLYIVESLVSHKLSTIVRFSTIQIGFIK